MSTLITKVIGFQGLLFLFLIALKGIHAFSNARPVVNTTIGLIQGSRATDGEYNMFMGIPYGQVNRSNPFGMATPQEPFNGVFNAIDDTAKCPQLEEFNSTIVGSVDCLHINIYAPITASDTNLKPVMLMIYGGGFNTGFAGRYVYGPKFLVRHDVIFVTLNYRVGPYGFMCLEIPEVPGNIGLKDQLMAMRWVKENIRAFGGDPNKITAFGNSAGGISVDLHLVSQQEKLFDQILLQSGTKLLPTLQVANRNVAFELAAYFNFTTSDLYEALNFLAEKSEYDVIKATTDLDMIFSPCIEKSFEGVESIATEDWTRAPIPKSQNMNILLGFNINEYIMLTLDPVVDNSEFATKLNAGFNTSSPNFERMIDIVHRFYVGDDDVSPEKIYEVADFNSDLLIVHPHFRSIAKYLENKAGDIYLYVFSYFGNRNYVQSRFNVSLGTAGHADDIGYLFDISYMDTPNAQDQLFIDRMTAMWTNFAKFGNPTPETSELLPVIWEPIKDDSTFHYLDLGSELVAGIRPFNRRMSFWDLFYEANDDLQDVHGYAGSTPDFFY